jgi:polyhydroxybutyrate depolymerase
MNGHVILAAIAGLLANLAGSALAGCSEAGTAPCKVDLGEYHIALPSQPDAGSTPAVMFLHGWQSNGENVLNNNGLREALHDHGYALIAPNGSRSDLERSGGGWVYRSDHGDRRDDAAFLDQVAWDAAARHGIARDQIVLAGFSSGGSMVSYTACETPNLFVAYAPIGGGFWRPHPEGCDGPVKLFHTHGWTDKTVPLEGRFLRNGTLAQGDIFRTFEIWRDTNGCDAMRADDFVVTGDYWRRIWTSCDPGTALELALFPGGHVIPEGWVPMMLEWAEALDRSEAPE